VRVGIVFDLDDTLYPEQSYNLSGFRAVGEYVLRHHRVEDFAQVCERLFNSGARANVFDLAAHVVGVELPIPELVSAYREHEPQIELFEDARWILADMQGRFPLGLITDGYASVQRRKVSALGLENVFDSLVFSDDFGRASWKPSQLPYRLTMTNLENVAESFVYIGDNPDKDFVTARALGWDTVMVDRPAKVRQHVNVPPELRADHRIESLREIPWDKLRANK
jgi:putative hydrolase of the HAD superfamily